MKVRNKYFFKAHWHLKPAFLKKRILRFNRPKWKKTKLILIRVVKNFQKYEFILKEQKKASIYYTLKKFKNSITGFKQNPKTYKFFNKVVQFLKKEKLRKYLLRKVMFKRLVNFHKNFYIYKKKSLLLKKAHKYYRRGKMRQRAFKKALLEQKALYKNLIKTMIQLKIEQRTFRYAYFFKKEFLIEKVFNQFFINAGCIFVPGQLKTRRKYIFKNILQTRAAVLNYFYNCLPIKFFKNLNFTKNYKLDFAYAFIQPEFRLDILLWRLKFFTNPYLARFAFQKNLILLNLKKKNKLDFKKILGKGDIITLKSKYKFRKILKIYIKFYYLPSFIEFDYYTNQIILLEAFDNLNDKDLNSIVKRYLSVDMLKNYLNKKSYGV